MSGKNIKCYAYFGMVNGVEYRAGTMLVGNDDERIIGNCIMKNPGSARPLDDTLFKREDGRQEFSVDATMYAVAELFGIDKNGGTVRIWNLSDTREADFDKAKTTIVIADNDGGFDMSVPTYIGWGDFWKNPDVARRAESFFWRSIRFSTFLYPDMKRNKFIHPLYLMRYARNKPECKKIVEQLRERLTILKEDLLNDKNE